ncbi:hypothetical protein [Paracoccus xiamenensis]|uniref:hypothetical protein n=1 Tax=Paracoccus xiamenensis TaxID=2714901 RepID=UPI00140DE467|nr:hypothetical protein [Paracoccus xiamenensis]NHF71888.1 hypothetical protein [Paracoccus xiamenensis]
MNEQTKRGAIAPAMDFALGFQPDGVQLLSRNGGTWAELGRAPFDGDLRGALSGFVQQLRAANAPGLALVIPGDQILYTELQLPPAASADAALHAGLEGLTPYRVEDLAFDYAPTDAAPGSMVKVAAVARQTLQEAEDFAVRHGFAPDRFVAAPQADQFPHAPDFGATELAAEWAHATEIADDLGNEAAEPAAQPELSLVAAATSAVAAPGPVISRITRHVVNIAAPAEPAASVNLGSIVLLGDDAGAEPAETPVAPDTPAGPMVTDPPQAARPEKVMPDRARAFHERAQAARQMRPPLAAPARERPAAGRRMGLSGALPMVGLLVLGLGIAAAISSRDPAPEADAPTAAVTTAPAATAPASAPAVATPPATTSVPAPAAQNAVPTVPRTAPAAAAPAPTQNPAVVATGPSVPAPAAAVPQEAVSQTPVTDTNAGQAQTSAASVPAVAPPQQVISGASDLLGQSPAPAATAAAPEQVPQPATAAQDPAPAAQTPPAVAQVPAVAAKPEARPAVASSARPKSRPADLARVSTPTAEPSRSSAPSASAGNNTPAAAPAARPASRPAQEPAARSSASRSPGAPDSSTLRSSARPKTAPSRSAPAQASAQPDTRPAVPRNPQPYERRAQPEPTGSRPPPKPAGSSNQGAALHTQPAPIRLSMFTQAGHAAMLDRLDRPWAETRTEVAIPLIRTAQARPSRKPTRSDAVDDAVAAAIAADRPAARASSAASTAAPARGALGRSDRPRHRPSGLASAGSASTSGLSAATNAAVEEAIAAAVSSSAAVPGRVALTALRSSARPQRRGNVPAQAPAERGGSASGQEGTLAPVPDAAAASKAAAEAAALAERRRLDDELQRQAEQRARNRAAADAQAAAQAKAAAEARARAQAEAEAAAAARKNQRYRPPEVDNEPEVAAAPSAPTNTSTAGAATNRGIDLNATQLIGTVGAGKASRGLIRLRNGKIVTVRLGDKINGGQITQIGNGGLRYVKAGKQYSLPILNGR